MSEKPLLGRCSGCHEPGVYFPAWFDHYCQKCAHGLILNQAAEDHLTALLELRMTTGEALTAALERLERAGA